MKKLLAIATLAAFAACTTLTAQDAPKKETPKKDAPAEKKAARGLPSKGKITAIDKTAKTIKVGEKVYAISATTKINKSGQPATLDDAVVGENVGIYFRESDSGKLELLTLNLGLKPAEPKPKKEEPKK